MSQYLLSVQLIEGQQPPSQEVMEQTYADVDAFNDELQQAGAWVFAGGLLPPEETTVVRERDGEVLTTDGPFAEAKEYIGGFWIIECADRDAALEWASKATVACRAPVEVRPFEDEPED